MVGADMESREEKKDWEKEKRDTEARLRAHIRRGGESSAHHSDHRNECVLNHRLYHRGGQSRPRSTTLW